MNVDHGGDLRKHRWRLLVATEKILSAAEQERRRLLAIAADKWQAAFIDAAAQPPLLVVGRQIAYYLVEFRKGAQDARHTSGLMLADTHDGTVGSVTAVEKSEDSIRFHQPAEVLTLLDNRDLLVRNSEAEFPPVVRIRLTAQEVAIAGELYWEPCDQSLSPFQPFYVVHYVGGDYRFGPRSHGVREGQVFVRVDGEIYTEITFGGAGM